MAPIGRILATCRLSLTFGWFSHLLRKKSNKICFYYSPKLRSVQNVTETSMRTNSSNQDDFGSQLGRLSRLVSAFPAGWRIERPSSRLTWTWKSFCITGMPSAYKRFCERDICWRWDENLRFLLADRRGTKVTQWLIGNAELWMLLEVTIWCREQSSLVPHKVLNDTSKYHNICHLDRFCRCMIYHVWETPEK